MQPQTKSSVIVGVMCFLAAGPALAAADLRVVIPAPAAQYVYANTQYGIAVSNIGNQSAAAVKLTVDLPATHTSPTKYVMGSLAAVDSRCALAGTRLTCTIGTLAKGKSTTVSFALAFNTAVKARRLRLNGGRDFARTLWAQFRSTPRLFFLPPREVPNEAAEAAPQQAGTVSDRAREGERVR